MVDLEDMTDEAYFGVMKELFKTDGWQTFCLELEDQAKVLQDVQDINSVEDLYFVKGQLSAIGKILSFEDLIERTEREQEVDDILAAQEPI